MSSSAIHPLQIEIFERLRISKEGLRFSEMLPEGIESDLYNYHLKQLVKLGYIEKVDSKYLMTNQGREYIVDLAPLRLGMPPRLKIAAMCLALRKSKDGYEVLYQKRLREPHLGSVVMVAGGLKRGESLEDAARRRLKEEAGLDSDPHWVGTLRKVRLGEKDGKPWSDITYHICASFEPTGKLISKNQFGEHYWVSLEEAAKIQKEQRLNSEFIGNYLLSLARDIKNLDNGFYEEEYSTTDIW